MAAVLVLTGAAAIVGATAYLFWPAAVIVGGVLLLLAGIDLRS